jgi:hypothetical protein
MEKRLLVLLLSAAVLSGVGTFAQGPPPAPTPLRVRGTIGKYDAATRTLSLSTPNGTVQFRVASTARIRQGRQDADGLELQKLEGYRAAVRYSESGGGKTAESVHVFGKDGRTDR